MNNVSFNLQMTELSKKLGTNTLNQEWEYFKEYARKFPENSNERKYGILPIGALPSEENMIYANDTPELRITHLKYVSENGINIGHKARLHLDWLEKMEGKQR